MNTDTATKPAKSVFYDGTFKKTSDVEDAKKNNGNIDDFHKYPICRALQFNQTREAGIAKLCKGLDTKLVSDGQWVIEGKVVKDKIQYTIMEDKEFKETFTKYDASGILGCGKGSERFTKKASLFQRVLKSLRKLGVRKQYGHVSNACTHKH